MNQAQLLAELSSRPSFIAVSDPFAAELDSNSHPVVISGVQWKFCVVVEKSSDGRLAQRRKEYFYVKDEGLATEEAFYMEKEPPTALDQTATFVDTALTWLYAQGHANFARIVEADAARQKIRVVLYKESSATAALTRNAIVWRDGTGPVNLRYLD